jgi:hypothetical protein
MTALSRARSNINNRPLLWSERMLHKNYNRKCSVEKILVVGLKGLVAKMN